MQHYRDVVQDRSGNVIGGAIVTVIDHSSGQSAPLYSDANGSIPLTSVITDTNGTFSFYVASGRYDITVSKNGIVLSSVSDVFITVTADYPTAMDSTTAQAGTSTTPQTVSASVLDGAIEYGAFTPSGTGAVSRTVQSKLRDVVSVMDFIPAGTNTATTDCASWISSAILAAQGNTLYFPSSHYLVNSGLVFPTNVNLDIIFANGAKILAGADNITICLISGSWYLGKIDNFFIDGNGHTNVTGFDLTHFVVGNSINFPSFTNIEHGIIYRSLCGGTIDTISCQAVLYPITIIDGCSNTQIRNPNFDGGFIIGIDIQSGTTYPNVGVEVLGGFIQGGATGITDQAMNTKVRGTYFEVNSNADIFLNTGSRYFIGDATNHTAIGVVAYKGVNADSAKIYNVFMTSGGRTTGLFDFDNTNTGCVYDLIFNSIAMNSPLGITTGIKPVLSVPQKIGDITPNTGAFTTLSSTNLSTLAAVLTNKGNSTILTSTPTTIFTMSGASRGRYEVCALIPNSGGPSQYSAFATAIFDGSGGRIVAQNGSSLTLTLSGLNIQVTQTAGSSQPVYWSYLYIALV